MKRKVTLGCRVTVAVAFLLAFVGASIAVPSDYIQLALFGPEVFQRSGDPVERTFNTPSTQGTFTMHVINGDGAGNDLVSSAIIKVNGNTIVKKSDFNQQVTLIEKPLTNLVQGNNTLSVEVSNKSSSYSYITVSITGDYLLNVTITAPTSGTVIYSDRVTVLGTYVAYTGSVDVSVNGVAATLGSGTFTASDVPLVSGGNTLTATVTTIDGIQDQDSVNVSGNLPPMADAGLDQVVTVGQVATLDGRNSSDPEGDLITYSWGFLAVPTGSASALDDPFSVMPSFVPDLPGSYILDLIVNDGHSNSLPDNVTLTAEIPNVAPTANAGPDQSVVTGDPVYLDGTASFDPEGSPLTYFWQFLSLPSGSAATLDDPVSATPSFVADLDGQYLVELTVNDGQLGSLPDNVAITAETPNAPPVANAGLDNTFSRNTLIQLDGTQSYDPDSDPLTYAWSIVSRPPGSTSVFDNAASPTPTILADAEGDFVFRLVVNDGEVDSAPDTVVITVVNDPPVADAGPDQEVVVNTVLTLDGSGSSDPNGDPLTYQWSVASAPAGSTATVSNPTIVNPLFTPDLAGTYTIQLVVNDGYVNSAPDNVVITATVPVVTVPDVVGTTQASAEAAIIAAGLTVGTVTNANSNTVPAGSVISQNPTGGSSAPEGSPVDLVVSLGPAMVPVPNVVGMTQANAESTIIASGLIVGTVTHANSGSVPAGDVISQSPIGGTSVPTGSAVDIVVSDGPAPVTVPNVFGKPQANAEGVIIAAGLTVGNVTQGYSDHVIPGGVISQNPAAGSSVSLGSNVDLVVSQGPAPVTLPPDPSSVAPPVDETAVTSLLAASEFLYTGIDPIQTGVVPGTIELKRVAVLRGQVKNRDDLPLPGVTITILNHPEFGQTITRADGMFDMAVNGGGPLTVDYRKGGYLPGQRQVNVPWQDYAWLPDVVMVPFDNQVTAIDLTLPDPIQVAQGSVVTDSDGTRQASLLFTQGTQATMTLPDNTTQPLSALNVRATEYTIGGNGPNAMPAELPPNTGYTYAVDLSVDEAVAAGATDVQFDQPVIQYMENFLDFPVGENVPVGYYDRKKGAWVASDDGKIIEIVGVTGGLADIDTDGDGAADNTAVLSALGITDAERTQLASLYTPGTSLWRVQITHFSPWDFNWPFIPPGDATPPNQPPPRFEKPVSCPTTIGGSVIECENQVLGESVALAGTPFSLNYRSNRVPGRTTGYSLKIFLSGDTVPSSAIRIKLLITVAGRYFTASFPPSLFQSYTFTWDGMDAYGRVLQGEHPIEVKWAYVYEGVYSKSSGSGSSFGYSGNGVAITGSITRGELSIWQEWEGTIGGWDARAQGLGGWSLNVQHAYDPIGRVLYEGDGTIRSADAIGYDISRVAGTGAVGSVQCVYDPLPEENQPATQVALAYPNAVAVGPDGSKYIADEHRKLLKVDPDGMITKRLITGPAPPAWCWNLPRGVDIGPDETLYVVLQKSDGAPGSTQVVSLSPDGVTTVVAGDGISGFSGDGGPATAARLNYPRGVAVGPDGSLYIADTGNSRVRRVAPDGIINTVAGIGGGVAAPWTGDGGLATDAIVQARDVAVGPDGSLYIAGAYGFSWGGGIRRVTPDGIITSVIGYAGVGCDGDGGPAIQGRLRNPVGIAIGPDGSIYIADRDCHNVRRVGPDGTLTTIAGNGATGIDGDFGPGTQANVGYPSGVAVGPDKKIYITQSGLSGTPEHVLRVLDLPFQGISDTEIAVASRDGKEVYVFDGSGKHLWTVDALTNSMTYQFGYDNNGLMVQITDGDNNVTTIGRDANGDPTSIVAPGNQQTVLSLDGNGFLDSIADPAGNTYQFGYSNDGLLTSLIEPNNDSSYSFVYDTEGRLERDDDPEGGFKSLARTETTNGYFVTIDTAEGRSSKYEMEYLSTGETRQEVTFPTGAKNERVIGLNGVSTTTFSDGVVAELTEGPDPRFRMGAPVPTKITLQTPGGLLYTRTASRTVALSDPADPMSLISQTENTTINGRAFTQVFDAGTMEFTDTSPVGRQTVTGIDNQGRVLSVNVDPAVDNVTFAYDPIGRLEQAGQADKTWTFGYDGLNRLTSVTDPTDNVVQYGYDDADRVTQVILPSGRTYGFGYDNNSNTTSITMPSGVVHSLGYNKVNLDNSYVPPSNPAYATEYNLDREWVRTTLPSGRAIDGAYDNGGRLFGMSYPEADITLVYTDNTERVFSITRAGQDGSSQDLSFTYDGSLPTGVTFAGVSSGQYAFFYDNNFFVTGYSLDGGAVTTLGRDDDGLLTSHGPFTITRSGPAGAPSALSDGTLNVTYTYDSFGRLETRTHTVASTPVYQVQMAYDDVGRISQKIETVSGTPSTYDYTYDLDGQLYEVRRDTVLVEQYGYDNNANRTSTITTTATYDDQDRLEQQGGVNYTFDDDGFLTQRGSDTFQYSARGELLSATVAGQTITYQYDGMARRIGRTDAAGTYQYLYGNPGNPFQVTATRDAAGNLTTYFYDVAGNLFAFERGGQFYYVATDQLGTPKVVTDSAGAVVKVVEKDGFGVETYDSSPGFGLPIGFAGGIEDSVTGMVRFGFRDYEPATGRWAAKDPILFDGEQANLFSYIENDPVNQTDPTGLIDGVPRVPAYDPGSGGSPDWMNEPGVEEPLLDPINFLPAYRAGQAGKYCLASGVARGGWMNSNRYLRIGYGRWGGGKVFRISGKLVELIKKNGHINLWRVGPLGK